MNEQDLRNLVREAVERQLGGGRTPATPTQAAFREHPSHVRLVVAAGGDSDGACLIEPAVDCVNCGYCQSLGH